MRHRDYRGRTVLRQYADEWEEDHPPTSSWENTWWGIIIQVVILLALFIGIPLDLWLLFGH